MQICIELIGSHRFLKRGFRDLPAFCKLAEDKGVNQVSMADHVIMSENTQVYPYGKFPASPDFPFMEPLTMLTAIANSTDTIRLSTGILISPLRPAVFLSKQLATLDVLSNGRVTIGLGVGWQREEYPASGVEWEGRFGNMLEQIAVCRTLWTQAPASFHGKYANFDNLYSLPFPVQPTIPVWLGLAPTDLGVARIADHAQGWIPMERSPANLVDPIARIRAAFEARGRDPSTLAVRASIRPQRVNGVIDYTEARTLAEDFRSSGVTMLEFAPGHACQTSEEAESYLEEIVKIGRELSQ